MTGGAQESGANIALVALGKARKFVRKAQDARGRAYRRTGGTATAEREFENAANYDDEADEQFRIVESYLNGVSNG